MDLWIGNATRQIYQFNYKMPEIKLYRFITLQPGRQGKIANLTSTELDYIVWQHTMYGIVRHDEIDHWASFHGVCYAVDKMIPINQLTVLMESNLGFKVEEGRQTRINCAVAQSQLFDRVMEENGRPERVYALDLSAQQERQDPNNDVPQFSKGVSVSEDPNRQPPDAGRFRT